MQHNKTVIIGFGNILMGDEGIGVHIIHKLETEYKNYKIENIEFIDGGTSCMDVFLSLENNISKLIIIDAVIGDKNPGYIYKFYYSELEKIQSTGINKISLHELNIIDALKSVKEIIQLPKKIIFFGIQPKDIKPQIGLSEELKKKINNIIKSVMMEVRNDFYSTKIN